MSGNSQREKAHAFYQEMMSEHSPEDVMRELARTDLFFLLVYILNRDDADNDFVFDRCKEVQREPDEMLDLWAREHYKSTVITFALTIQEILNDPEVTIGIFSFTRPIAKGFLRQIKTEFEVNEKLQELFPNILYESPRKEALKWSEDAGLVVKRKGNPKEMTIEAWGLTDGQPTGRHFKILIYDDVVSQSAVSSPEQITKTTDAWAMSLNLGSTGCRHRYIGTRWAYKDTYHSIIERGAATPRMHPATKDGTEHGDPVFFSREALRQKRRFMGLRIFNAQMLQDPNPDNARGFQLDWMKYWRAREWGNLNRYILVDPANSKKKGSDYTTFTVYGLGADKNYYVITWVRDRLNLTERKNMLFQLHQQYHPIAVGYEQYGMQSDIAYIEESQDRENYRFPIIPLGGKIKKEDRIETLIPIAETGRLYLPDTCVRTNTEGDSQDLTKIYLDEALEFPFSDHDDMLDCGARITDEKLRAMFPTGGPLSDAMQEEYDPLTYGLDEGVA